MLYFVIDTIVLLHFFSLCWCFSLQGNKIVTVPLTDFPEEPLQQWEHSHCCCQHRPQTETQQAGDVQKVPEDVTVAGEQVPLVADPGEPGITAGSEDVPEARFTLGVPEERKQEERAGVLQEELQLSLSVTSAAEQEVEMLGPLAEAESCGGGSTVRRRKRRRRSKKVSE